jgi:predicted acyltransferase
VTAAARVAVAAVLVLAGSLAMLWAGTGPGGPAGMVRLLVMAAAVAAAGLALSALLPENERGGNP